MPLEDEFGDIVRKARFGLAIEPDEIARRTDILPSRLGVLESYQDLPTRDESRLLATVLQLDDRSLWDIVQGWAPPTDLDLGIFQVDVLRFEPMNSNGYIVTGPHIHGALLVDPGGAPERIITACEGKGGLSAIFLTHTHHDHIDALPAVVKAFSQVPVYVHAKGRDQVPPESNVHVVDGDRNERFGALDVRLALTPGHSDDGLSIALDERIMFVGDTLFAGSLGRSAEGAATYRTLLQSAHRLLEAPDETCLLPGHGPITTVGLEKKHNPFVARKYEEQVS